MVAQLSRHLAVLEVRVADDGDPDLGVPLADALRIAPGWIDTDLNVAFIEGMPDPVAFRQNIGRIHPVARTGRPAIVRSSAA
mgnify:CR=1 FL=1